MRGQPVEVKQQELYLGFILHEDGFVQSVMVTTKEHINKACYSCECWPGVPKCIICHLEAALKKMLYSILEFAQNTKYMAVLLRLCH